VQDNLNTGKIIYHADGVVFKLISIDQFVEESMDMPIEEKKEQDKCGDESTSMGIFYKKIEKEQQKQSCGATEKQHRKDR